MGGSNSACCTSLETVSGLQGSKGYAIHGSVDAEAGVRCVAGLVCATETSLRGQMQISSCSPISCEEMLDVLEVLFFRRRITPR